MSEMLIGRLEDSYEQLSFSGGGIRCFWQGGVLDELRDVRQLKPERIAAASGGALAAACFIAERGQRLLECFSDRMRRQQDNLHFEMTTDIRELTPHQQLYRDVVEEVLSDSASEQVANGPEFHILLARPPKFLPNKIGAAVTMALYEADKLIRSTPHGCFAQALGAEEMRIDARQAARDGRLADLVCIAATIPPVFRLKTWNGVAVIDAGTLDNAPVPRRRGGCTLVLLTRSYRNLPDVVGRTYLAPSHETPADKIDFTDAHALKATYEQGRKDMQSILAQSECQVRNA